MDRELKSVAGPVPAQPQPHATGAPAAPVLGPARPVPVAGLAQAHAQEPTDYPAAAGEQTGTVLAPLQRMTARHAPRGTVEERVSAKATAPLGRLTRATGRASRAGGVASSAVGTAGRRDGERPPDPGGSPLPERLRAGLERMSGLGMGDVRVHYDSPRPAEFNALGLTEGAQIHLAPGGREHVAHEAWHVVQQRQGLPGSLHAPAGEPAVHMDHRLEVEAQQRGALASVGSRRGPQHPSATHPVGSRAASGVVQLLTKEERQQLMEALAARPASPRRDPTPAQLDAMGRFTLLQVDGFFVLPQVKEGGWAAVAALGAVPVARTVPEIVALASMPLGARLASPPMIVTLLTKFTYAQIVSIVNSPDNNGSFRNWDDLLHLAEINDTADKLVALGQATNLAERPWLQTQIRQMAADGVEVEKKDQAGELDRSRSCWSWATQGFEKKPRGTDAFIYEYFRLRTNYPAMPGQRRQDHDSARDNATGVEEHRAWLEGHKAQLQGLVDQFAGTPRPDNAANRARRSREAQRALMEQMLTYSGFTVLPPETPSRWYIGMHEVKPYKDRDNKWVSSHFWEHWWIEMRRGGSTVGAADAIIETFPFRDPDKRVKAPDGSMVAGDGGGRHLTFTADHANAGDPEEDFTHRVPVLDLLPAQKAIIKRGATDLKYPFTDDMP